MAHHHPAPLKNKDHAVGTGVNENRSSEPVRSEDMRASAMMDRLWTDLSKGTDVGHYGRLVFCMIARHFLDEKEIIKLLGKSVPTEEAAAMLVEVNRTNYSPPRPAKIRQWQKNQQYKIIPEDKDQSWGNVYTELQLPQEIYENVTNFYKDTKEVHDLERKK